MILWLHEPSDGAGSEPISHDRAHYQVEGEMARVVVGMCSGFRILVAVSVMAVVPGCSKGSSQAPSAIVCPIAPSGTAYDLINGDTLRVMFSVVGNPAWTLLVTGVGFTSGASAESTQRLFNGNTLLGSQLANGNAGWKSAGTLEPGAIVVDFAAVQDGTIDGRLDYVANGAVRLNLTNLSIASVASSSSPAIAAPATIRSLSLVSTFLSLDDRCGGSRSPAADARGRVGRMAAAIITSSRFCGRIGL